jgi:outer membrane protein assembly factor BamB
MMTMMMKTMMKTLILPALVLLLTACCVPNASLAQGQFRGDAAHSGVFAGAAPQRAPKVKWTFVTGDRVVSSPVMHDGVLFFGSDNGHVYAVEAASRRERWRFRTGGPVSATPAVDGGRVFVGSYDGKFYALDEASGALVWKFATVGEKRFEARGLHGFLPRRQTVADPFDVYLSSPVVADVDGVADVAGGTVFLGSGDGHVYALAAASGQRRWAFDTGEVVHASPAVVGGVVYVGSRNSRFFALDARSGTERWRFQAGTDDLIHNQVGFQSSPAVVDGTVYVGCRDANLYALDTAAGREKWRYPTNGSWVVTSPAVSAGRVVFATSDSSLGRGLRAVQSPGPWSSSWWRQPCQASRALRMSEAQYSGASAVNAAHLCDRTKARATAQRTAPVLRHTPCDARRQVRLATRHVPDLVQERQGFRDLAEEASRPLRRPLAQDRQAGRP